MVIINLTNYYTEIKNDTNIEITTPRFSLIIAYSDSKLTKNDYIRLLDNYNINVPDPDNYVNRR